MKATNCYLCGSSHAEILFTFKGEDKYLAVVFDKTPEEDMNWMICKNCGLVFRSPVLEESEYNKLYSNYDTDIFSQTTPDQYFDRITSLPIGKSENKEKTRWLREVLQRHQASIAKTALDVGCGGGTLLHSLKEQFPAISLYGVELNPAYAELAKRRLNADIRNQNYENGIFGQKFDLLINTKVLEHIPDPLPFLQNMHQDLNGNGSLLIEVPHVADMFNFSLDNERFTIPHIYFFSEGTLGALLEQAGFSVLDSRVFDASRNRSYLQIVARKNDSPGSAPSISPPFDDVQAIARRVAENNKATKSAGAEHGH